MLVMCVIALVCVVGIVGGLASTLSYDQLVGQEARDLEPQPLPRPAPRRRSRRHSRQLRVLEGALAADEGHRPVAASPPRGVADPTAVEHTRRVRRP